VTSFGLDTAPHRRYLEQRGVPVDFALAHGFDFLGAAETRREVGVPSPSIKIGYRDLAGKPTGHARYRLLDPNSKAKFMQARNSQLRLYFPTLPKGSWAKVAKDPKKGLIVCEGEVKAARAALAGYACVGIGGAQAWQAGGELLVDWDLIEARGRHLTIATDTDFFWNTDVTRGYLGLGTRLAARGAAVQYKVLPDVVGNGRAGLDDFLHRAGPEAFEQLPAYALDSELIGKLRRRVDAEPEPMRLGLAALPGAWLDQPLPAQEFTVEPLIPARTVALLAAEGGTGKSSLALRLGLAVAGGEPFFSLKTQAQRVVFLALEDPPDVLRRRVHRFHHALLDELRVFRKDEGRAKRFDAHVRANLVIESLAGRQLHLVTLERGSVVQGPLLDQLIQRLKDAGGAGLVIIDPLSRAHGADENSNGVGTALINAAERVAGELDCSVLISHHTGKAAASAQSESMYAARGASGIADAARVMLRLRQIDEKEAAKITNVSPEDVQRGVLKLVNAKNNYAPRVPDLWLKRTQHGDFAPFVPEMAKAADDYDAGLARLAAWAQQRGAPFTKSAVANQHRAAIFGAIGRNAARDLVEDAIERGDVVPSGQAAAGAATTYVMKGAAP
jgi:hypothetical protein